MYYTGLSHPDQEPGMNRRRPPERRTTFTRDVAAKVVDGDLYLMQQAPAAQRFYVADPDDPSAMICVTHRFSKRWPEAPGSWEPYDAGGNIVFRASTPNPRQDAVDAILSALYRTPLGRVVGSAPLRDMAQAVAEVFGLTYEDQGTPDAFRVNPDREAALKNVVRDLLAYAPEHGYDDRLGAIGVDHDGVGFAADADEYAKLISGYTDGFGGKGTEEPLPFLSQPVFYAVLGSKSEGRGFQARLDALMKAVGLHDDEDA